MRYRLFLLIFFTFFIKKLICANDFFDKSQTFYSAQTGFTASENLQLTNKKVGIVFKENNRPSPLLRLFRAKRKKNQKITAAVLAFPFPFGIVGLHRIYLGCAPYVPVVYIASLGGAFGFLPFIDFWVLLLDKNTESYVNNKKVFMWVN
jgi:TM2 domain-containing membrane protein YozV